MRKLLLLLAAISWTHYAHSQSSLAKVIGVYKTPRWQTTETIKEAAQKQNAGYDAFYHIRSYDDFKYFENNHLLTFPGVYIFNKDLQPVKEISSGDCGWQAMQFISTLKNNTITTTDSSVKFSVQDLLTHCVLLTGDSAVLNNKDFDYLYIYTWVTYLPKFTKSQFEYSQKIKDNKNVRIKVICLNADFMAGWNKEPDKFAGKKVDTEK